ncbi:MAG: amidohydrolase family protein [Candidatus Methanomethylicaceae archaeon]
MPGFFLILMVIDFHTHIYPDHIAHSTVSFVCKRSGIKAYTDGTLNGLKRSMEEAGIDISVVAAVPTRPHQVKSIQNWLLSIRQPGIEVLGALHPHSPLSKEEIRYLKKMGIRGFKLHPDYQDFYVDDPMVFPLYEVIAEEGMFLLFHAGVDRGLPHPVHGTPKRFFRVHRTIPELRMVLAHLGGEFVYDETVKYLLGKDIYFDTSFVLQNAPLEFLKIIFKEHPADRILFATDSPWTNQKEELSFLSKLPFINADELEKICYYNAARLLGLEKKHQLSLKSLSIFV